MMSKKDYEMLAGIFKDQIDNLRVVKGIIDSGGLLDTVTGPKAVTLETMAYNLVQRLAANPRFDHKVFYEACGFSVEGNYPRVFSV